MLETVLSGLFDGSGLEVALRIGAIVAGFALGVRLLAVGGRTADEHDRILVDAVRRRDSAHES
ncbi:hypothetical protein [Caulobacter sp. 1776]|uniref:hypothetical protein n=1 Tax=Caulobacter sp. 1776 TaxID=3156420 RepID=UPI0033950367